MSLTSNNNLSSGLFIKARSRQIERRKTGCNIIYAKYTNSGKHVVIKQIPIDIHNKQDNNFSTENEIMKQLSLHPNIIGYHGCFLENNYLHIVMDYANNGSLRDYISLCFTQENLDYERYCCKVQKFFAQIVSGLAFMHYNHIIYRDMSPNNILIHRDPFTQQSVVKMIDFGFSKQLNFTEQQVNTQLGSSYFIAPEIIEGEPYNNIADVYALGCILYFMLTCSYYGQQYSGSCLLKYYKSQQSVLPSSQLQNHSIPNILLKILDVSMRTNKHDRYNVHQILQMCMQDQSMLQYFSDINFNMQQYGQIEKYLTM